MAFFKFRQRGQPQPEPTRGRGRKNEPAAPGPQETIDTLRRRARHRLIGAAVLVGLAALAELEKCHEILGQPTLGAPG